MLRSISSWTMVVVNFTLPSNPTITAATLDSCNHPAYATRKVTPDIPYLSVTGTIQIAVHLDRHGHVISVAVHGATLKGSVS